LNNKPANILFIQADQLAATYLGCYGNSVSKSPVIDKLAATGTLFDRAYTNFPLCAPSRFSMLSGKLASAIEAYDNGAEFPSSIPTFVHHLRAQGYQTCLSGKMHFVGADQLHGFEERLTTDLYPSDFGWTGDWTEVVMGQSNNDSTFNGAGICLRNPQMEYDEEVVHRACRKLYDIARGRDSRPFMLTVSMTHPHDPYQCRPEYWDRYLHEDIDMPAVGMLPEDKMDPFSKRLKAQYGLYESQPDEETVRIARHAYYGSVSYLDDQVGRLMSVLSETGLDENTMIVFTSDHGDMLGERGLWYKKCFFENAIRIPLIISLPQDNRGKFFKNVSLVDLFPTILEYADSDAGFLDIDGQLDGNSLMKVLQGQDDGWNDIVYSESLAEGANAAVLMVKDGALKYTLSGVDPEQLFDLDSDPLELNNLAGQVKYRKTQARLKSLAEKKWDVDQLTEKVKASQNNRLFIAAALRQGKKADWDYNAPDQSANQCLRPPETYNDWAYENLVGFRKPD